MELDDLLEEIREKHLQELFEILKKEQGNTIYKEVLIGGEDEKDILNYSRIDYVAEGKNGEKVPFLVGTGMSGLVEFEPFSFDYPSETGKNMEVTFTPFGWDSCGFGGEFNKDVLRESLVEWAQKWIVTENDPEYDEFFENKAHSISFEKDEGSDLEYLLVDFGSAEIFALYEILDILLASGVTDITLFS